MQCLLQQFCQVLQSKCARRHHIQQLQMDLLDTCLNVKVTHQHELTPVLRVAHGRVVLLSLVMLQEEVRLQEELICSKSLGFETLSF